MNFAAVLRKRKGERFWVGCVEKLIIDGMAFQRKNRMKVLKPDVGINYVS
jgi:hypothetical protein